MAWPACRRTGCGCTCAGGTTRGRITTTCPFSTSSTYIVDIAFAARPSGVSFEAANPRHAHEWRLFERVRLPEGKILIPGVLESKTNYIEHPELVAQRIGRYAKLVGRENVIAGTDCGFGTWVGQAAVDPGVVWAKLASLAEGARLASREFWP
jgi:5-methyltetrahydropteroyltriglutamate--homocysteine methyltransferase